MNFEDAVISVPPEASPQPLDRMLRSHYPEASWSKLRRLIETGKVAVNGETIREPAHGVRAGDTIALRMSAPRKSGSLLAPNAIVYADAHLVVAEKPSGLMSVPFEDERGTFVELVQRALERRTQRAVPPLGVVHRIDKETSGLLVFTRRASAKHSLEQQFRAHSIHRAYAALVHGRCPSRTFESRLVADRGDGLRGSTPNPKLGQHAITHVQVVESLERATLVECRLETGRTHQIRIHLSEAGHPLLGERVYIRNYTEPLLPAPRLMLHARKLGFIHPADGRELSFESALPDDFALRLRELRSKQQV